MTLDPMADAALAALEERVTRAVETIKELRREKSELAEKVRQLEAEVAAGSGRASQAELDAVQGELSQARTERDNLLSERRRLTERVEGILARLQYLESESVAH